MSIEEAKLEVKFETPEWIKEAIKLSADRNEKLNMQLEAVNREIQRNQNEISLIIKAFAEGKIENYTLDEDLNLIENGK